MQAEAPGARDWVATQASDHYLRRILLSTLARGNGPWETRFRGGHYACICETCSGNQENNIKFILFLSKTSFYTQFWTWECALNIQIQAVRCIKSLTKILMSYCQDFCLSSWKSKVKILQEFKMVSCQFRLFGNTLGAPSAWWLGYWSSESAILRRRPQETDTRSETPDQRKTPLWSLTWSRYLPRKGSESRRRGCWGTCSNGGNLWHSWWQYRSWTFLLTGSFAHLAASAPWGYFRCGIPIDLEGGFMGPSTKSEQGVCHTGSRRQMSVPRRGDFDEARSSAATVAAMWRCDPWCPAHCSSPSRETRCTAASLRWCHATHLKSATIQCDGLVELKNLQCDWFPWLSCEKSLLLARQFSSFLQHDHYG